MNTALETKLKGLPKEPGVYFHKSKSGEIIYVGKAAVPGDRKSSLGASSGRDMCRH